MAFNGFPPPARKKKLLYGGAERAEHMPLPYRPDYPQSNNALAYKRLPPAPAAGDDDVTYSLPEDAPADTDITDFDLDVEADLDDFS